MHTSWPKAASSLGRLPMTSATPPSLARGTASVATIKILKRMSFVMLASHNRRKPVRRICYLLSYHMRRMVAQGNLLGEEGKSALPPATGATLLVEYNAPCPLCYAGVRTPCRKDELCYE